MRPVVVKAANRNQVTLPDALVRALGVPSRFRVFAHDGTLMLFSACLATYDEQAKAAGVSASVLRRAYASAVGQEAVDAGGRDGGA